jgi:glucokinase
MNLQRPSWILSADLGGTKIAVARVSSSGRISDRRVGPTPVSGGGAAVDALTALLSELPRDGAVGIGVDVPGLAYPDGAVWAPNIRGWKRMRLRQIVERRLRLPVLVESDRNAFVVGEAWKGAARGSGDVVFLIVGTGIGAGILSGGRLIRGHAELSGAIGWMAVRDRYLPEYAAVGCLEAHSAGPAIGIAAGARLGRSLTAREVVRLANSGNREAMSLIEDAGVTLGLALANLVSTLNPEVIVVGGGVAAAGEMLLRPARRTMLRWGQPLAARQVRVIRSRLGERAGLLGVAKLAFQRFAPATIEEK